jgi:protoporphyrinogen/coproporphyrinogen III oxidase
LSPIFGVARRNGIAPMSTVIIGGGISGLSAAYYLSKRGIPSRIVESRPRLGGVIETGYIEGCTIEAGPDSFLAAKPAALELIRELGMADQVIGSNDHLRVTFVKKKGRLVPLPDGLMMMVPTRVLPLATTPLLSIGTKVRMGLELLRSPKSRGEDESVADFVRAHYGQETVDYLAEPLLSGIYGGDPQELSVRATLPRFVELAEQYGSLTRGVLASRAAAPKTPAPIFRTLQGGLGDLVDALARAIAAYTTVHTARAESIERTDSGYRIRIAGDWVEADRIVLACEAHSAATLIAGLDARAAELLGGVGYSSSMTVAIGYNAADFERPPVGFGFLIPKKERRRLVACTWVGTKFANRVPEDKIVARCFLGGADDKSVLNEPDDAVIAMVTTELREIAGVTARPVFTRIARWPRAMAQYPVGHAVRLAELEARIATLPGIHLAGNAYQGIGIPDCIRMGRAAAEKVAGGTI